MTKALALAERAQICDLFTELGPDHPTLCEGWTNYHLAAHLVVREWNPVAAAGIVVAPLAGLHDKAIAKTMQRRGFEQLVSRIRKGAPPWWKPVEGLTNFVEYFIHVEDVRRGAGDHTPRPADGIADLEAALWKALERGAKLAVRGVKGAGVDLVDDHGDVIHARAAGPGEDVVTITGRPGEVQLYLVGRRAAAQVSIDGSPAALAALDAAKLGI